MHPLCEDRVCRPWLELDIVVALYEVAYIIPHFILIPSSLDLLCLVLCPDFLHLPVYLLDCRVLPRLCHLAQTELV